MAACALAHGTREAEYLDEAKRWDRNELETFSHALAALVMEMESRPFTDLLGGHYMDLALSHKGQQWGGEFHTPQPVCELMARIIAGDVAPPEGDGPITLCEPTCGAGAMILAYAHALPPEARPRLRVTAIDLSRVACNMCFINTTLWGIPTEVIHGDTLRMTFFATWRNVHWIFRGQLHLLTGLAAGSEKEKGTPQTDHAAAMSVLTKTVMASATEEQGRPPSPEKAEQIKAALGQQTLDFS